MPLSAARDGRPIRTVTLLVLCFVGATSCSSGSPVTRELDGTVAEVAPPSNLEFCHELTTASRGLTPPTGPSIDDREFKYQYVAAYRRLLVVAPDELRSDIEVMLAAAISDSVGDSTTHRVEERAASNRVLSWANEHCA